MDRFADMRCFVQVVDLGSVTKAAKAMRVAPSAVSRRIKELEARLGTQLLIRTTRRMSLTEAGRTFHLRCQRILGDLDEAEAEASDRHGALKGSLRVAAPLAFGIAHLTPIIVDFMDAHPGVEIDLDLSDRAVDLVAEGFEIAIRIGVLRDSSLIARKLVDVRMVACAAPSLLAKYGMPSHPDQLRDWPALCYTGSERPDIWRYRAPDGSEGSAAMQVRMLSNNGSLLCDVAIAGQGVVLQPSFHVDKAVAQGQLVPILRDFGWPEIAIYTVYPQTRHLSARARALIDFVRSRIGSKPYWEAFLDAPGT
jgi:DNA-binding transcriptional LysR family regulator